MAFLPHGAPRAPTAAEKVWDMSDALFGDKNGLLGFPARPVIGEKFLHRHLRLNLGRKRSKNVVPAQCITIFSLDHHAGRVVNDTTVMLDFVPPPHDVFIDRTCQVKDLRNPGTIDCHTSAAQPRHAAVSGRPRSARPRAPIPRYNEARSVPRKKLARSSPGWQRRASTREHSSRSWARA